MTDVTNPGALAPVQPGDGAFKETAQQVQVNPAAVPDSGGNQVLDQILAAIRDGKDAKAIADTADKPAKADILPEKVVAPDTEGKYKPSGNKVLDVAVQTFIKMTGATEGDIERALQYATEAGDVRLIDVAFLKERFGDNAEQAQALAEAVMEQNQSSAKALLDTVYTAAGGEANFKSAAELFKANAKPGMVNVVKQMLDSGDPDTVKEAAMLIVEYGSKSGGLVKQGDKLIATSGFNAAAGISAEEFTLARQKLNSTSRTYHQDYARLMDLRRIGKQLNK